MDKLEKEIEKAKEEVYKASKRLLKQYNKNNLGFYQERVEYLRGLKKAKELLEESK